MIKRVILLGAALVAFVVVPVSHAAEAAKGPFAGTWNCVQKAPNYPDQPFVLTLEQNGNVITGTAASGEGEAPLTGKVEGDSFSFEIEAGGGSYKGSGKLEGGALKGTWTQASSGAQGTWEGTRK